MLDQLEEVPGYRTDPVGDLASRAGPGLLQKYRGRALLVTTGACAINCRYCFRRYFPYERENASRDHFAPALDVIRADASLREVLLSGGDPLTLSDRRLAALFEELQAIPHLRRVRIHSRLPIVLPERIDDGFLVAWSRLQLQKVMVVHANHAREIDASVRAAVGALRDAGTTVLNQSVLLRGINDRADDLVERCLRAGHHRLEQESLRLSISADHHEEKNHRQRPDAEELHVLARGAGREEIPSGLQAATDAATDARAWRLRRQIHDRLPSRVPHELVRPCPPFARTA